MPLEHAILAFLNIGPSTGYDLKKNFDVSVKHFWSAAQSHIYKALKTIESEGWATLEVIQQDGKPNRKEYHISPAGRQELNRWISTPLPLDDPREAWMIQVFFGHEHTNEELDGLIEARVTNLRTQLAILEGAARAAIEQQRQDGSRNPKRMVDLWQFTLDYGIAYHQWQIEWLDKKRSFLRDLPPMDGLD